MNKIQISSDSGLDIDELKEFLSSEGYSSHFLEVSNNNTLGGVDLSILQVILGSTAIATTITGLFNCIRDYLKIQIEKEKINAEKEKIKVVIIDNNRTLNVEITHQNIEDAKKIYDDFYSKKLENE